MAALFLAALGSFFFGGIAVLLLLAWSPESGVKGEVWGGLLSTPSPKQAEPCYLQ